MSLLLSTSPALAHNYTFSFFFLWPVTSSGENIFAGVMSNMLVGQCQTYRLNKPLVSLKKKNDKIVFLSHKRNHSSFTSALKCRKQKC